MLRRILAGGLATLALAALPTPTATTVAFAADDGLDVTADTRFEIDGTNGHVHVTVTIAATNTIGDKVSGATILRSYFSTVGLFIDPVASIPSAIDDQGRALAITSTPTTNTQVAQPIQIALPEKLFYRQTARLTVRYDLLGATPRSHERTRTNPSYSAFYVAGNGDAGRASITVVAPDGYEVELFGDTMTKETRASGVEYTATGLDPTKFFVFVSARNDHSLDHADVTSSGIDVRLDTWPGDAKWRDFLTQQLDRGLPALRALVGRPWPIDGRLDVLETSTPYLYGYAGWYSAADRKIEVGEDLDGETVLHELSHAWLSRRWFADRWISEGLAQVYAAKATTMLGGFPSTPQAPSSTDAGHVALENWGNDGTARGTDDQERYGYNAAFWVTSQIVRDLGTERMRQVFAAVDTHGTAYPTGGRDEPVTLATDWRRLLDLAEEAGGSAKIEQVFKDYVLANHDEVAQLDVRTSARRRYGALQRDGGDWAPPLGVRREMEQWRFDLAADAMKDAEAVLAEKRALDKDIAVLGGTYPDRFRADYEAATDNFAKVLGEVRSARITADALVRAHDALQRPVGLLQIVGRYGSHLQRDLDTAVAALAAGDDGRAQAMAFRVSSAVQTAHSAGVRRVAWTIGALLAIVLIVMASVVLRRRRRRQREQPQVPPQGEALVDEDVSDGSEPSGDSLVPGSTGDGVAE